MFVCGGVANIKDYLFVRMLIYLTPSVTINTLYLTIIRILTNFII